MQRIRMCVAALSLFAILSLSGSAIVALPKNISTRVRDALSQLQKQMSKLKGRIVKILDDLPREQDVDSASVVDSVVVPGGCVQRIRRYVTAVSRLAMLCIIGSAIAAKQGNDSSPARDT